MQLAQSTSSSIQEAITNSPDWRSAAFDAITFLVSQGQCFSSGEVASALRQHRPDLAFRVTGIGEFVRDSFYNQTLPCYDDGAGNPLSPLQVARLTVGSGRTPAGVTVFVYGPDQAACDVHPFEIDIPNPPASAMNVNTAPTVPGPVTAPVAKATPADLSDVHAYVGPDGRCYIPRKLVDSFLQQAGIALRYGDQLHVTVDADSALVMATATPDSRPYSVWASTGRLAFPGAGGRPLTPGQKFRVEVGPGCILVVLNKAI